MINELKTNSYETELALIEHDMKMNDRNLLDTERMTNIALIIGSIGMIAACLIQSDFAIIAVAFLACAAFTGYEWRTQVKHRTLLQRDKFELEIEQARNQVKAEA
ncbi:hypothetical protein PXH69_24675 [Rhodococcus qingshengii]|uniref:Uncharacterized protein n=1 Tax=Rhodococcus qingshengii TaxID=334542 RepID=A0AAW6LKI2_RHOSG|nr:hypothetical protein [Rhodococcus qingshengii]MDE8648167.1 hypothetical protein [Rhodococcus qingshengii]